MDGVVLFTCAGVYLTMAMLIILHVFLRNVAKAALCRLEVFPRLPPSTLALLSRPAASSSHANVLHAATGTGPGTIVQGPEPASFARAGASGAEGEDGSLVLDAARNQSGGGP